MNIFLRLYKTSRLVTGFIRTIIYASITQIYINQRRLLNKLFAFMAYLSLYIRVPPSASGKPVNYGLAVRIPVNFELESRILNDKKV